MSKFLLSIYTFLQLAVLVIAQDQVLSVVETPSGTSTIDYNISPAWYQETDTPTPTLIPSLNTVAPVTQLPAQSLLGKQLNRIAPPHVDHSPFVTARCNCNQNIPTSQTGYFGPTSGLPLVGSPSLLGHTTPGMHHGGSNPAPPVVYNNPPAYCPPCGFSHCPNSYRALRLQRGGIFARRTTR